MLDERLRTELRRATRTMPPGDAFERVERKLRSRRRRATSRKVAVIVCALALSVATVAGLREMFVSEPRPASGAGQGFILFSSGHYPTAGIYVSTPDGQHMRRLATGVDPVPSPDGTKIAFYRPILRPILGGSRPRETFALELMNSDGSGIERLLTLDPIASPVMIEMGGKPTWSPDGTQLVFVNPIDGTGRPSNAVDLSSINADGTGFHRLTFTGSSWNPAWSPDGRSIAFVSHGRLMVMKADGRNQHRLTDQIRWAEDPVWSPDGRTIAVSNDTDIDIVSMEGQTRTLVRTPALARSPAWSPDGSQIAYLGWAPGNTWEIRRVEVSTGTQLPGVVPLSIVNNGSTVSWVRQLD